MSEVKNTKVEFVDNDHIFVDNKQFISLKYYAEKINSHAEYTVNEVKVLSDKLNELAKENEALKTLLKKQLGEDKKDSSSTEMLVNKMCASEDDHEWECIGMSTAGSDYRCKKCGAHKTVPVNYQPLQPFYDSPAFDHIPNCCKACPNHPSNGGSGICNCTAPYFEQGVTCTNTVQTSNVTKLDY